MGNLKNRNMSKPPGMRRVAGSSPAGANSRTARPTHDGRAAGANSRRALPSHRGESLGQGRLVLQLMSSPHRPVRRQFPLQSWRIRRICDSPEVVRPVVPMYVRFCGTISVQCSLADIRRQRVSRMHGYWLRYGAERHIAASSGTVPSAGSAPRSILHLRQVRDLGPGWTQRPVGTLDRILHSRGRRR